MVGARCRTYEVLPEERAAICEFASGFPKIGYRKLTWMMVDAGTVCVGGKHGLSSVERGGSAVALEALGGLERRIQFPTRGTQPAVAYRRDCTSGSLPGSTFW
jgi:hypothetical protein